MTGMAAGSYAAGGRRRARSWWLWAAVCAALMAFAPVRAHAQRRAPSSFAAAAVERSLAVDANAASGAVVAADDTLPARRRPVAIEYSDWYNRRLRIHQVSSWAMLPLFAVQYKAGQELLDKGHDGAPEWARDWHGPLAGATGVLFGVNTVTGLWNLYDARKDPKARKWRTAHAILMLVADAGFAAAPAFAEDEGGEGDRYRVGGNDGSRIQTHKRIAVTSMGIAAVSWIMMLPPFRHE